MRDGGIKTERMEGKGEKWRDGQIGGSKNGGKRDERME